MRKNSYTLKSRELFFCVAIFATAACSNTPVEPVREIEAKGTAFQSVEKYDDASWHFDGEFPSSSPIEFGGTHIGLFLKWAFQQGWAGERHLLESPEAVRAVIEGEMSGTEFLFTYCDGRITSEDLSTDGNMFASAYYGDDGLYLYDYSEQFGSLMYVTSEADHDFGTFSQILDSRRRSGTLSNADAQ